MRKILLSAVAIVFAMGVSIAQHPTFGIKGGLNIATIGGDIEEVESLTSFHIGGFAQFEFSDKFTLKPELLYSEQGAQNENDSDLKTKLNYFNLPVIVKYMIDENLTVEAGPQIGFAISRKLTNGDNDIDFDDEIKLLDFGFDLGAGYELDNGMIFSARYTLGLSNILEDDAGGDENSFNNNVFNFQ